MTRLELAEARSNKGWTQDSDDVKDALAWALAMLREAEQEWQCEAGEYSAVDCIDDKRIAKDDWCHRCTWLAKLREEA